MCVTEPLEGLDDVTIKMKSFATSSSTTATSVHSQTLSYFSAGTPIRIVPSQPSVEIRIIPNYTYTPLCCTLVLWLYPAEQAHLLDRICVSPR